MPTQPQDFKKKSKKNKSNTVKAISSAADFKRKANKLVDVELPSGNVVQVRRVDLPSLLADGAFPDTLMAIVQDKVSDAKAQPEASESELVEDMLGDTDKIAELFTAFDNIVVRTVVQPAVRNLIYAETCKPIPDDERDDEFVYTDEIDLNDKIFIFQFSVGGDADLESFREKSGTAVADLEDVAKLQ